MDYTDTLTVIKNNVLFRNKKALLLLAKTYNVNQQIITIKKYFWDKGTHAGLNLFLTDKGKLILARNMHDYIIEYDTKKNTELQKAILKDTVFLKPEWKF